MIQRIQSVYLLLAALVSGCVIFFLPLFVFSDSSYMILDDAIFTATTVLSALISLYSIFRYKNRRQQLVSGRINIIINFVFFGFLLYMFFAGITKEGVSLGLGSFMPLVAVVLITLANRGIMKDEMLVRAADRLR
jgi:peptidoglycan/LPS O-acetylase OafA/YrhL